MVLNSHGYILDTKEAVDWAINKYIKWSTVNKSEKLTDCCRLLVLMVYEEYE